MLLMPLVCKLLKNLYGLKQGANEWNRKFNDILITNGFKMSENDPCRGLRVYPSPGVSPYPTRTRGSGTGRVGVSRVGSGTGKVITGTGVPGFTRTDV